MTRTTSLLLRTGVAMGCLGVPLAFWPDAANPFGPAKLVAILLAGSLTALGIATDEEVRSRIFTSRRASLVALAALFSVLVAGATVSRDPILALIGVYPGYIGILSMSSAGIVGLGLAILAASDDGRRFATRIIVLTLGLTSLYGLVQTAGFDVLSYRSDVYDVLRARSTLGNASNLGILLLLAIPWSLHSARTEVGWWRYGSIGATVVGVTALAFSYSRSAWIGALIGVIWLLAVSLTEQGDRRVRRRRVEFWVTGTILTLIAAVLFVPRVSSRVLGALGPESTFAWRLRVWDATSHLIADHPLLGVGVAHFRYEFPAYRIPPSLAGGQVVEDPHNLFLSMAVAGGVLAMLLLAVLLVVALIGAWRMRDWASGSFRLAVLGTGLAASIVALQAHYLTIDTAPLFLGALLSLLLDGLWASRARKLFAGSHTWTITWSVIGIALFIASVGALGSLQADRLVVLALQEAEADIEWEAVEGTLDRAESLAPWEPSIVVARIRAANQRLSIVFAQDVADAGTSISEEVRVSLSRDPMALAEAGELRLTIGLGTRMTSEFEAGKSLFDAAIAIDPAKAEHYVGRGIASAGMGAWDEAEEDFRRATVLNPRLAEGWTNLSIALRELGREAEAIEAFQRAQELD